MTSSFFIRVASEVMSKIEIFLLAMVLTILFSALWFIFSGEIWVWVSYLEMQIDPSLVVPE